MRTTSTKERVAQAAAAGVRWGLAYFVLGFVLQVARGHSLSEMSLPAGIAMAVIYFAGGCSAGIVVGLAKPVITSHPRAVIVFTVAALPIVTGVSAVFFSGDHARRIVFLSALVGLVGGTYYWFNHHRE